MKTCLGPDTGVRSEGILGADREAVASGASSGKSNASLKGGRVLEVNPGSELLKKKIVKKVHFCDCQAFCTLPAHNK